MAVRGSEAKELVTKTILSIFNNSFLDGKDIRIPVMWDGEEIQIKVSLTASKTNVEHDSNGVVKAAIPAEAKDVVPIGPLTEEQKEKILNALYGIIDIDLTPVPTAIEEQDVPF